MLVDEISAERLAEVFHHYHRTFAETSQGITAAVADSWSELPQPEKDRMIDAARLTLLELDSDPTPRKYFAKAGEAEWGC